MLRFFVGFQALEFQLLQTPICRYVYTLLFCWVWFRAVKVGQNYQINNKKCNDSTSSHPIFEPWTHEVCMSIVELCISIENQTAYNYNVQNMYQTRVFYILILPRRHAILMSYCICPSNKVVYSFLLPIHTLHII